MHLTHPPRLLSLLGSLLFALTLSAATPSAWVYPGPSGHLVHQPDLLGNRIIDMSAAGYQGGIVPLPSSNTVPVKATVSPVAGDNTANIQTAINQVSALPLDTNGFRGAVLLAAGIYPCSNTIRISASGVVLRGVGSFTNGSGTVIEATASNEYTLVEISGTGSATTVGGTTHNITNSYTPAGARSFYVDSAAGLSPGDLVYVRRVATSNWIHDLGMDLLGPLPDVPWTPSGYNIDMERTITHMEGNHVFVDAPITCAIDTHYTNGTIRKFTWSGRITNVGIEHIFGKSDFFGSNTNETHGWTFVQFDRVVNGWARDLTSQYFGLNCVSANSGDKFITVADCKSYDPISIITGGRRYAFNINDAQYCLVRNCYDREDRHQFVCESVTIGPNVFVDGLSDNAHGEAGPHQRWATGVLWDNITVHGGNNDIQNAGNFGTGHGWEGANCVIWNNAANGFIVQNPPGARNWLIGSIGPIQNGTAYIGPHDPGTYEFTGSAGTNAFPNSLYFAQLQDRLASPGVQKRDYWTGVIDGFTNSSPGGDVVAVDSTWRTAVQGAAGAQPIDAFNVVSNNHWVPFTFNCSIASTERVVSATLSVSMRAFTSAAGNTLFFNSITNTFSFSALGWLPVLTSNSTVRVVDLTSQVAGATNGQFNFAVQGDGGIDWAMLELQVAPNSSAAFVALAPVADATVRGGTNGGGNFGSITTLTAAADPSTNNVQQAYLRWDLSSVSGKIAQAQVRLVPVAVSTSGLEQGVGQANSNGWSEGVITANNQPGRIERFATWIPAVNSPVVFDVTPQVLDALTGDKQLSLQLFSVRTGSVDYGSREAADTNTRPQLLLLILSAGPAISQISDQTIAPNGSSGPIAFTVSDPNAAAATLIVSGSSSDPSLVPNGNIVFGGSGSNRTVTITPAPNQNGVATVTITVTDPGALTASTTFNVTISSHAPSTIIWNGPGAGANNWSTPGNWLPAQTPEFLDDVKFVDAGIAGGTGIVNNSVDIIFSGRIASLQYANTNGAHTTLLATGATLDVSGTKGLVVGTETDNGGAQALNTVVTGSGAVTIENSSANVIVRQGSVTAGSQRATLNLSGLDTFTASVNQVLVGTIGPINRATGTLLLARTNAITVIGTPGILVGDNNSNGGGQDFVYLGQTNQIFADSITVARQKANAILRFNAAFTNAGALFRGSDGSSRVSSWNIGDNSLQSSSSSASIGTNDFTGGTVDILVDAMVLGKSQKTTNGATSLGVLTFTSGGIDVNTVQIGAQSTVNATNAGVGQVNVISTNALLSVNSVLELGHVSGGVGGGNSFGSLNVNGGVVAANTISAGSGNGANTLAFTSGTLLLTNTAGAPAAPIAVVTLANSTLQLSPAFGLTNIVAVNLVTGGGSNVVNIASLPNSLPVPAQLPLIAYNGSIGGAGYNFQLGNLPAALVIGGYLSNNIANSSVDLVITNYLVPDPFLTWDGDFSGDWDSETANWKNNVAPDLTYADGAVVLFNDAATGATTVNLTDSLTPSSVTVSNNTKAYTFGSAGALSGAMSLDKEGAGTLTLANSGSNDFSGSITIGGGTLIVGDGATNGNLPAGGSVTDNATLVFNRSDVVAVPNLIAGSGLVVQSGSGVLALNGANTFTAALVVTNGTVLAGNASALGAASGATIVTNGGSLDVNGLNLTAEPVIVAGGGVNGAGAIVNGGPAQTSALRQITLAGNATFGGTNRWDLRNTGGTASLNTSPAGSAFKITKVGTNQVSLVGVTVIDAAFGDIDVKEGTFAVQTTTVQLGNPNATITVFSNAVLNVFRLTNTPLNKVLVLSNGATFFSENDSNRIAGPATLYGNVTNNVNTGGPAPSLTWLNVVSGPGGITKIGAAPLIFVTNDTYTGSTVISAGALMLRGNGSISNSALISIAAGATLDASGRADGLLSVNNGQTLTGSGNVVGSLSVNSGAKLAPGGAPGTLAVSGAATLSGTIVMELNKTTLTNDVLQAGGLISYGGTLMLTNLSGALAAGDSFQLFSGASAGAFAAIVPATPAPGLMWDTSQLTVSGRLGVAVAPRPAIATVTLVPGGIVLSGTNGPPNGSFSVLAATNVTLPLSNWTVIGTNSFGPSGNFSVTNPVSGAQLFYLLQLR
jgi:autotransporter-associated beta strand protein